MPTDEDLFPRRNGSFKPKYIAQMYWKEDQQEDLFDAKTCGRTTS